MNQPHRFGAGAYRIFPIVSAAVFFLLIPFSTRSSTGGALGQDDEEIVSVLAKSKAAGDGALVDLGVAIKPGWHINANKLDDEFLIPTTVAVQAPPATRFEEFVYPKPEALTFSFAPGTLLKVYQGDIHVTCRVSGLFDAAIPATLRYQACNDRQCLPPKTIKFRIPPPVEKKAAAEGAATETPGASQGTVSAPPPEGSAPPAANTSGLASMGFLARILAVFVGGLLLNLTPCIYPMIPITVGYFGNQSQGSLRRSFGLASLYVLGMALTYSTLGVIAATTGAMFGRLLQSPVVLIGIAAMMVALALSSFGLYELRMPASLTSKATSRKGKAGALIMGLLMGIIAAPCIGPFIVALLTYVGTLGSTVIGFTLFFVLALGLGTPFLFLAAFSGSMNLLPRSGDWMLGVRRIFGTLLLGAAVYFIGPVLDPGLYAYVWRLSALAGAIYLLGFEPLGQAPGKLGIGFKTTFVILMIGIFWFSGALSPSRKGEGITFQPFGQIALKNSKKPVLVDFTADWCVPCRELEESTFKDAGVVELSRKFLTLQADITKESPEYKALMERYQVKGPPTVLFLSQDGSEARELRVEGYLDATGFAKRLKQALAGIG